jgi:hypothetical protein
MKRFLLGLNHLFLFLFLLGCNSGSKNETAEKPTGFILQESDLPDFEMNIDHKALLTALDDRQGESIRTGNIFTITPASIAMEILSKRVLCPMHLNFGKKNLR